MNFAAIKPFDVANGPGVRVSLFVSGCRHRCKGCFNQEAWDFAYGEVFTPESLDRILKALKPDYIKGFSLLGGEPFEPENQLILAEVLEKIKEVYPDKSIWCYTGYTYESDLLSGRLCNKDTTERMLSCIDILVDGRFIEEKKNLSLRFKGSENQRIIDLRKSEGAGCIILWEGDRNEI